MIKKLKKLIAVRNGSIWQKKRQANIAFFHIGRVGSTVVGNLLSQHEEFYWGGEIFHPKKYELNAKRYGQLSPMDVVQIASGKAGSKSFGFVTKFHPRFDLKRIGLSLEDWIEGLIGVGYSHFVVMERRNMLKRYVSDLIGASRNQWHLKNGETASPCRVKVDIEGAYWAGSRKPLLKWFEEFESLHDQVRHIVRVKKVPNLDVFYEDSIEDDPRVACEEICQFIGLSEFHPQIKFNKTNPFPLNEVVENWNEVVEKLGDTKYEWMVRQ